MRRIICAQIHFRKGLRNPKSRLNEWESVGNTENAIICVRKLRLVFRHYLVTWLPLSIQLRSLIIDFYALISWLLSGNRDVAIVMWKVKTKWLNLIILCHVKDVWLGEEKYFSSTKSYCFLLSIILDLSTSRHIFQPNSLVFSSSSFMVILYHFLWLNLINIIYGNSWSLQDPIGNHLLNILDVSNTMLNVLLQSFLPITPFDKHSYYVSLTK